MRKIIHIDMDAFYAAVEQRDHPEYRGKPVIVGGPAERRGVVATCSYEARRFGVHSAMSSARAKQLCPKAVFVSPRFKVYRQVSAQLRAIFSEYTDLIEPIALDEAYLDVTKNKKNIPSATHIAQAIKKQIFETTQLTASAGVSFNKFLAKIASDLNKPDGLTVITPKQAPGIINKLPIREFQGIGKVTEQKMLRLNIKTGGDLKKCSEEFLVQHFGKTGRYFFSIAQGKDERSVRAHRERKSISCETTFAKDLLETSELHKELSKLSRHLSKTLHKKEVWARTLTLKVKYDDFQQVTRSQTLEASFREESEIIGLSQELLAKTEAGQRKVRLLGVGAASLSREALAREEEPQLSFDL